MGAAGPHWTSNPEAVIVLLKIQLLHEQQPSTLEPVEWSKLKLFRDDWAVVPKDITSVAPPAEAAMFHDVSQFRRSEEFVRKKGGQIRMVVDRRHTNSSHRSPPHVALGSPGAPLAGVYVDNFVILGSCREDACEAVQAKAPAVSAAQGQAFEDACEAVEAKAPTVSAAQGEPF